MLAYQEALEPNVSLLFRLIDQTVVSLSASFFIVSSEILFIRTNHLCSGVGAVKCSMAYLAAAKTAFEHKKLGYIFLVSCPYRLYRTQTQLQQKGHHL